MLFYYFVTFYFILGLKIKDAKYPKINAPEIPTALEVKPPLNNPKKPDSSMASFIPFHRLFPKPSNGTVAPQPAHFEKGS